MPESDTEPTPPDPDDDAASDPDSGADDPTPTERLEAAIADHLAASAELKAAAEAYREAESPAAPGLYEGLKRTAREDTQQLKRLLGSSRFEIELSPADVDAWDEIPPTEDPTTNDRPFR